MKKKQFLMSSMAIAALLAAGSANAAAEEVTTAEATTVTAVTEETTAEATTVAEEATTDTAVSVEETTTAATEAATDTAASVEETTTAATEETIVTSEETAVEETTVEEATVADTTVERNPVDFSNINTDVTVTSQTFYPGDYTLSDEAQAEIYSQLNLNDIQYIDSYGSYIYLEQIPVIVSTPLADGVTLSEEDIERVKQVIFSQYTTDAIMSIDLSPVSATSTGYKTGGALVFTKADGSPLGAEMAVVNLTNDSYDNFTTTVKVRVHQHITDVVKTAQEFDVTLHLTVVDNIVTDVAVSPVNEVTGESTTTDATASTETVATTTEASAAYGSTGLVDSDALLSSFQAGDYTAISGTWAGPEGRVITFDAYGNLIYTSPQNSWSSVYTFSSYNAETGTYTFVDPSISYTGSPSFVFDPATGIMTMVGAGANNLQFARITEEASTATVETTSASTTASSKATKQAAAKPATKASQSSNQTTTLPNTGETANQLTLVGILTSLVAMGGLAFNRFKKQK